MEIKRNNWKETEINVNKWKEREYMKIHAFEIDNFKCCLAFHTGDVAKSLNHHAGRKQCSLYNSMEKTWSPPKLEVSKLATSIS